MAEREEILPPDVAADVARAENVLAYLNLNDLRRMMVLDIIVSRWSEKIADALPEAARLSAQPATLRDYSSKSGPPPTLDATAGFDTRRAIGCILAYVDEERREKTRFNDLNARAVDALLDDWWKLRCGGGATPTLFAPEVAEEEAERAVYDYAEQRDCTLVVALHHVLQQFVNRRAQTTGRASGDPA